MITFFKKLFYKISKHNVENMKIGDRIWVYFPIVNEYFKMEVSTIMSKRFKARFLKESDWNISGVESDYNQDDNDIIFSKKTFCPILIERNKHEN